MERGGRRGGFSDVQRSVEGPPPPPDPPPPKEPKLSFKVGTPEVWIIFPHIWNHQLPTFFYFSTSSFWAKCDLILRPLDPPILGPSTQTGANVAPPLTSPPPSEGWSFHLKYLGITRAQVRPKSVFVDRSRRGGTRNRPT